MVRGEYLMLRTWSRLGGLEYGPVDEHASAGIQTALNKLNAVGEVLEEILVVYIVDCNGLVYVVFELVLVDGQVQDGQHVRDVVFLQRFCASDGEETGCERSVWALQVRGEEGANLPSDEQLQLPRDFVEDRHGYLLLMLRHGGIGRVRREAFSHTASSVRCNMSRGI